MVDQKITEFDANTTPLVTDLVAIVDDPGSTPKTEKITLANLFTIPSHTTAKARAYRTDSQTVGDASSTKVELDNESYDPGSNFDDVTNYRFVAPVAGYYLVAGMIEYAANATGARYCNINLNGSIYSGHSNNAVAKAAHATRVSHTNIIYMAATHYVELIAYQTSGGSLNTSTTNKPYLTVHLLSV